MTQLVTCRSGNLSKTLLSFHHPIAAVYIYKYSSLYFCRFVTNAEKKKKNRHLMGWQPFEHILPLCVLFRSLDSATCEVNIILHFIMKVFNFFFFISKFGVWASHFRFSADNISKRLA